MQNNEIIHSGRKWKVHKLLGKGTCCSTYLASLSTEEDTRVALKKFKDGEIYAGAFERESSLLQFIHKKSKNCTNIVKLTDSFSNGGTCYLLEELLDLSVYHMIVMSENRGLSFNIIQILLKDIQSGLQCLHQYGYVHGDIKPSNLLWSAVDNCLKIIDFSLTFHQDDQNFHEIQSVGYRAPEADRSRNYGHSNTHQPLNTSVDLWSLGCVLVQLFTGEKLFPSQASLRDIISEPNIEESSMLEVHINNALEDEKDARGILENTSDYEYYKHLKDLAHRLLKIDPSERISIADIPNHPFCKMKTVPEYQDFLLMTSSVLCLINLIEDGDIQNSKKLHDLKEQMKNECEKYGPVKKLIIPVESVAKNKIYVEFFYSHHSIAAFEGLTGEIFNDRTLLVTYFPIKDFEEGHFS